MRVVVTDKALQRVLDAQCAEAAQKDVPDEVIAYAAEATVRRLGGLPDRVRRATPYFRAVVRRQVLQRADGRRAVARMIADTVVGDLMASGRQPSEVVQELERGWESSLGRELIEEYRQRLCA